MRPRTTPLLVAVLALGTAGCVRRGDPPPRPVLVADERVYRIEVVGDCLAAVGADGETAPSAAVNGWYVLSPGRVARIGERLRRCPE